MNIINNQKILFWKLFNKYSLICFYRANLWNWVFFEYFEHEEFFYFWNKIKYKNYKYINTSNIFFQKFSTLYVYLNQKLFNKKILVLSTNLFNIIIFNIKWILLALIITVIYFYISLFYIQIESTKQFTIWFILLVVFYLLISTFNNFLVKYKFGKFTSAIQRFWKRTGLVFWLIEGFLFFLFFYYFLNSSQEPLYMFDYSSLNQELLIQLKISYKNLILLSLAIYLSFLLILNNNFLNYYQNILILIFISLIIFYMLFIETYQFVYIISIFSEKIWNFDKDTNLWVLNFEQNNLRVKQQYFILCLIAKYWHFIFIFISWFFFLIKCLEINKINYNLLGYNVQNLLILYILNLFCLIQWIKWLFKKFLEIVYYWFFTQFDEKFFTIIINELVNIIKSLLVVDYYIIYNIKIKIISIYIYYINTINLWKYI